MFNVYPVQLWYKRINSNGVLAGIPLNCRFGMPTVADAKRAQEQLENRNNSDHVFYDFEIVEKK